MEMAALHDEAMIVKEKLLVVFTPEQIGNLVGGVHVHGQLVQVAGDVGSLRWKLFTENSPLLLPERRAGCRRRRGRCRQDETWCPAPQRSETPEMD